MKLRFIAAAAVIIFVAMFFAGGALTERCVDISGCRQCWKTTPRLVTSDLCGGNATCTAQPGDQQNNAIVDAVICGCDKARATNYADASINFKIEDVVTKFTGYNISASQLCEQPGLFLTKRSYT